MATKATKLPSGNWRSVANLGKNPDGKPRRKSFTAPTRKEAERLAAAAELDYEEYKDKPNLNLTLGDAWDRFLEMRDPISSPATIATCSHKKNGVLKCFMSYPLSELDQITIQEKISELSRTYKPTTLRAALGSLCTVIKTFDPTFQVQVQLPKDDRDEIVIPDEADIKTLIDAADKMGNKELALAFVIASQLGLRRAEICALTFADVADEKISVNKTMVRTRDYEWVIKSPKTKTSKRILSQTPQITQRLKAFSGAPSDRIITMTPECITSSTAYLQRKCGVEHFRFHDLRHYNASIQIAMNVPMLYIARRLGHKDDKMIKKVYGHMKKDKMEEIDAQIGAYFA